MEKFYAAQTDVTPKIIFNPEIMVLEISGVSRPESVKGFYQKFFDWINQNEKEIILKLNTVPFLKWNLR